MHAPHDHQPATSRLERVEAIARQCAPHLYAQRATRDGAGAWAAYRLEVASILRADARLSHPSAARYGGVVDESGDEVVVPLDSLDEALADGPWASWALAHAEPDELAARRAARATRR